MANVAWLTDLGVTDEEVFQAVMRCQHHESTEKEEVIDWTCPHAAEPSGCRCQRLFSQGLVGTVVIRQ